jgi:hypothetical protein
MQPGYKVVRLISVDEVALLFCETSRMTGPRAPVVQRNVLYLGEINDTQELACAKLLRLPAVGTEYDCGSDLSPRPDDAAACRRAPSIWKLARLAEERRAIWRP